LQTGRSPRSWLVCKTRRNRSSFHTHFALLRSHGWRRILDFRRQGAGTPRPPAQIAAGRGTEKLDVDRGGRRGWLAAQRHELTPGSERSAWDIGLPTGRSRPCFMCSATRSWQTTPCSLRRRSRVSPLRFGSVGVRRVAWGEEWQSTAPLGIVFCLCEVSKTDRFRASAPQSRDRALLEDCAKGPVTAVARPTGSDGSSMRR
jgi:hypothetical protein